MRAQTGFFAAAAAFITNQPAADAGNDNAQKIFKIFHDKYPSSVHVDDSLTTAAGLWSVAGIGLAIGAGMYPVGIFATLLILVVQLLSYGPLKKLDDSFLKYNGKAEGGYPAVCFHYIRNL